MLLTRSLPHVLDDLGMSIPTRPLAGSVRESSPPYGTSPERSPAEVARELVDAWQALARAESAVALAEGDTLRLLADQRLYLRLGFSGFHDFCVEAAEMAASTAKRRVAVSRLAAEVPALRDALLDGKVSQCQALALRPVVANESAAWWIAVAARSTVTELRAAVRQASGATAGSGSSGSEDGSEEGSEGRRISIAAPVAARLAWEEGLEQARKVLGYDAPRHACVAAMLAEAAAGGVGSAPDGGNDPAPDSELGNSEPGRGEPRRGEPGCEEPGHEEPGRSESELDSEPTDPLQRRLQRLCRSQHPSSPFATSRGTSEKTSGTATDAASNADPIAGEDSAAGSHGADNDTEARHAAATATPLDATEGAMGTRHAAESATGSRVPESAMETGRAAESSTRTGPTAETHGVAAESGSPMTATALKAVPGYLRESMKRAQRTLDQVYEQLDCFRELLEEAPTEADASDPASIVERLEEIRALSAPIHVLSLRVLFHLEDVSATRYLGLRSQEKLAEKFLRVSPRTYRQALAEAWQMKRRPELETAYLSGGIGVSRLRSLSLVEPRRLAKFLNRARRVTLRQLKRELRLHEKLVILRDQLQRERSAQERFAERHQDVERGVKPGPNHHCKDRPPVLVLSDSDLDPLPGKELDAKLACILLQHGHLAHELATNLTRPGLCSPEEAATLLAKARRLAHRARSAARRHGYGSSVCSDADSDPHFSDGSGSSSSCGMDLHFSDESGAHAISGSKPHSRDGSDPHSNRRSGADSPDDGAGLHSDGADVGGFEIYQRDPAANPSLMRLLETLVDLALLSVCDDAVLIGSQVSPRGRQSLNLDGDYCRISFWAPDPVIEDLNHFLDHVRERVGPLPAWAALMILVREAIDTWKKVDPKKKPRFWRVFERDEFRCRVPACSRRRDMHGHHIKFRSHGGSDDPSNVVAACYQHHQQGVHDGHLQCSGNANHQLRWVLGPKARRGGPFRVYCGDLRVG